MFNTSEYVSKFKTLFSKIFDNKYFIVLYILGLFFVLGLEYFEGNYFESEWLFVVGIGILGIILTVYSVISFEKLHKVAFVTILIFGLLAVFYYPILTLPDEAEHFTRAELTSHGDLFLTGYSEFGYRTIRSVSVLIDHNREIAFGNSVVNEEIDYSIDYYDSAFAQNLFYCYVPQALGVLLAKLLGLSVIWMLWLGRLCNLLFYAVVCCFAIRKAPFFKLQLFVVACLPLSIQQAASMSSDATFICLGLLTLAYFFYLYVKDDMSVGFREIGIFFVLSLLVALIKPPFVMFAVLLLLIPKSKFKSKKEYKLTWFVVALSFIFIFLWNLLYMIPQLSNSNRQVIYDYFGINANDQLSFILNNPIPAVLTLGSLHVVGVVFEGFFHFGDLMSAYIVDFTPKVLFLLFIVFYFLLLFLYPQGNLKINKKTRIFSFIITVVVYFGVIFTQYLTWTPVGANYVSGLQGRYFLPLLALLPLSFTINTNFSFLNDNKKELDLAIIVLMIVFLSSVFILLIYFYYMSGLYYGASLV